jgi:nitric oxide reductase activation protein
MNYYSVQDAYQAMYGVREENDITIQSVYHSMYETKGYEDHEVSMIRAQLHSIQKSCESLMKHMKGEETDVEAWVQAKITTAAEDLHAAANYIESGESKVK